MCEPAFAGGAPVALHRSDMAHVLDRPLPKLIESTRTPLLRVMLIYFFNLFLDAFLDYKGREVHLAGKHTADTSLSSPQIPSDSEGRKPIGRIIQSSAG